MGVERFGVNLLSDRGWLRRGGVPENELLDSRAGPVRWDPHSLIDVLPDPLVVIDADGRVCWGNSAATEQLGWRLPDLVGRPATLFVHPDDVGLAAEALTTVYTKALGTPIELRVRAADGGYRLMELRGRPVVDPCGAPLIVAILRDITERRRWEVGAGNSAMVQSLIECSPLITMLVGVNGQVRSTSAALVRQLGQPLEATVGRPFVDLVASDDRARVETALTTLGRGATVSFEARFLDAGGLGIAHLVTAVNLIEDPVVAGLVVTAQNITELVKARDQLHHLANHDPLTGLLNRAGLLDAMGAALAREHHLAVVLIDLDGFKKVNDRHGHQGGDHVLIEVARRIDALARDAPVGRLGGDEFVILLTHNAVSRTRAFLIELSRAVAAPMRVAGATVTIGAACGAALAQPGDDPNSLLAAADRFMYDAKRRQSGRLGKVSGW